MIWQLPKKKQKKEVTITANSGFYLNGVLKSSGTYTADTGDTVKVLISNARQAASQVLVGTIIVNGEAVAQQTSPYVNIEHSFDISLNTKTILISYEISDEIIYGKNFIHLTYNITTS